MINTIYGTKSAMQQTFTKAGGMVPVTVVKYQPNVVVQVKNQEKDGYEALQLGIGTKKAKSISKPLLGHFKKSQTFPIYLKEVKILSENQLKVGDKIEVVDVLKAGDLV